MALKDIVQASTRKKELDNDAIKEEVNNHLNEYRELIAY